MPKFFSKLGEVIREVWAFIKSVASEADGTGSATRVHMAVTVVFSMFLLWKVVDHINHLTDVSALSLFLNFIPTFIYSLMGFIALPYTVNKGSKLLSGLGAAMSGRPDQSGQPQQNQPGQPNPNQFPLNFPQR
jgi:hypothetical protein